MDPRPGRRDLVLASGATSKMRKVRKNEWTKAKEVKFLTALAETCNVTLSAMEVGISTQAAYNRRERNAAFRLAWGEAIAVAYRRLELMLLERSFNGTEKLITRKDGSGRRGHPGDEQVDRSHAQ